MRLGENDKVMVLARTDHDDEAQTEQIDASEAEASPLPSSWPRWKPPMPRQKPKRLRRKKRQKNNFSAG